MFINLRPVLLSHSLTQSFSLLLSLFLQRQVDSKQQKEVPEIAERISLQFTPHYTLGKDNGRGTPSSNDGAGSAAAAAEPCGCLFQYVYAMLHALNRIRVFCVVLVVSLLQFPECSLDRSPSLSLSVFLSFFFSFSLSLSIYFNSSLCVF